MVKKLNWRDLPKDEQIEFFEKTVNKLSYNDLFEYLHGYSHSEMVIDMIEVVLEDDNDDEFCETMDWMEERLKGKFYD